MSARKQKILAPEASIGKQSTTLREVQDQDTKLDDNSPSHKRALLRQVERSTLISLADQVAGDNHHERNIKFPGADAAYPDVVDARVRFVAKYYAYAKGGPLYVDEPRTFKEMLKCHEKKKVMNRLKLRYVVIEPQYETEDHKLMPGSTLGDLLEQLDT